MSSYEAVNRNSPFGENYSPHIAEEWPVIVNNNVNVAVEYTFAVASSNPIATSLESGENATSLILESQ